MAKIKVEGNIKIGFIYECIFGNFKNKDSLETTIDSKDADDENYDYRIPLEIIKKRAVVVIGKFKGQYIVIPISSTEDKNGKKESAESRGFHIRLKNNDLPLVGKYAESKVCWAKCNLITTVDGGRLRDIYDPSSKKYVNAHEMTSDSMNAIKLGIMKIIGIS